MKRGCGKTRRPTGVRLLLLAFFAFLLTDTATVKAESEEEHWVQRLQAPSLADPRENFVVLWCDYDLQDKELYSVNWYKNNKMLYRYMPSLTTKGTSFPTESDVDVSLERSNSTHLVLQGNRNVTKNMAAYQGTYLCEVSTEQPFLVDYAEANVTTGIIPKKNPQLEGVASNYYVGEQLKATCTSAPTLPASELSFYLNNKKVEGKKVQQVFQKNADGSISTKLSLTMRLDNYNFPNGILNLSCRVTLPGIRLEREYKTEKTATLAAQRLAQELPSIFKRSIGSSIEAFGLLPLIGFFILL